MPPSPIHAETEGQRPLAFVGAPAFFVAMAFCAGIGAAQVLVRPPAWTLLAAAFSFLAVLLCPRVTQLMAKFCLLLAWIATGMFCATAQPHPAAAPALRAALLRQDTAQTVSGTVLPATRPRPPDASELREHPTQTLQIALAQVDGMATEGGNGPQLLRLTAILPSQGATAAACGDMVTLTAKIHPPPRYYTPGVWNQQEWLAEQGVFTEGSVHAEAITRQAAAHRSLGCVLAAARNHALDKLDAVAARMQQWPPRWQFAALSPADANLLAAALLGDRTRLDAEDRSAFQRVGAFHLLVVSGLSIALIAGGLWWLLRRLRVPPVAATVATLALLFAYAELTGMAPPVERALLMTAVYMAGRLLYRRSSPLNTLSVAALVLLAADPTALATTSLQMTLLAVAAIAGVVSPLLARSTAGYIHASRDLHIPTDASLPPKQAQFRVTLRLWARALRPLLGFRAANWLPGAVARTVLHLADLAFVSFVLQLALAVPMAVDFHRVVALGVGANLLTVPLLMLLLPVAMLTVVLACCWLPAALAPAAVTALLLHIAAGTVHRLALLPQAEWRTPPTRPVAIIAAMVCLLAAILFANRVVERVHRFASPLAIAMVIAAGALALWTVPLRLHNNALEVAALDVGQGDSILLVTPRGQTLLVDAGGPAGPFSNAAAGDYFGEEIVSPYLWSRGIRRLDAVALTHAHSDHMGGMAAVLRNFRPRELWVGNNPPVPAYLQLLLTAQQLGVRVRAFKCGDAFAFGGADFAVLAPAADYVPGNAPANDDSLVLRAAFGNTSALLEGDAQKPSEQAMLASAFDRPLLAAGLLKVGHHGSLSSTTPEFLAAVRPGWAVISAGRHNLYGHPRFPIVQRLAEEHARVYRTDMDGASAFLLDGQTVNAVEP